MRDEWRVADLGEGPWKEKEEEGGGPGTRDSGSRGSTASAAPSAEARRLNPEAAHQTGQPR